MRGKTINSVLKTRRSRGGELIRRVQIVYRAHTHYTQLCLCYDTGCSYLHNLLLMLYVVLKSY